MRQPETWRSQRRSIDREAKAVRRDQPKKPVQNARLTLAGPGLTATTATSDSSGRATLHFATPADGKLTITATDPGHSALRATITIKR